MMVSASSGDLKVLGAYELLEKIGEGGMGAVYKARRHGSAELVAVKVLPPAKGNTAVRLRRFEQEFHAAQRLDHPNVVKVLAYGADKGFHYLAMELVSGKSVAEVIGGLGKLPESQALAIILKVAA